MPASLYRLQVTTKDGGTVSKLQAFTVNYLPLPVITTLAPASGDPNTTVPFTLTGNYFLNGGTTVMLRTVGITLPATLNSVNTTTVQGSFAIPYNAPTGPYTLYVITDLRGVQQQTGRVHGQSVPRTHNRHHLAGIRVAEHNGRLHPYRHQLRSPVQPP